MSSQGPRLRADSRSPAQYASIQHQLQRFAPEMHAAIFAVARHHIRLAELSLSFPALLAALAYPREGLERSRIIAMVIDGLPLPAVAQAARVPLWLRYMPPHLLTTPLPLLPDSAYLRHRMVNHFPCHPRHSAQWFGAIAEGGRWVHEEFALWCARNFAVAAPRRRRSHWRRPGSVFPLLCLWAWYSGQPQTRAHSLIATPWSPDMHRPAALSAAFDWRDSLELELILGSSRIEDHWLQPGSVDGYSFAPLSSAAEIDVEGRAMRNCVRTYGDVVASGYTRLWNVSRDGERIATLEISRRAQSPVPAINQLCLAENKDPSAELWLAAHRWIHGQELVQLPALTPANRSMLDPVAWRRLWKPFWLARRRLPDWLPLSPSWTILRCA